MLRSIISRLFPYQFHALVYWSRYWRVARKLGNHFKERERLFDEMVQRSVGHASLQIGVRGQKYAPHWTSVDLYDQSELIDYHYDVQDMPFEDASFEFIACKAILEHIPYPEQAISEFWRLLKPGGEVWIEVPMNQPYHPSPQDYWRVTPEGMRIWMQKFEERSLGLFSPYNNIAYNAIFYHGIKPL